MLRAECASLPVAPGRDDAAVNATGAVPLVRTSERNDFKRCPWFWWQHWVEGWAPKREPTWAWFGTAIHKALEVRYPVGDTRTKLSTVLEAFEDSLHGEQRRMVSHNLEYDEEDFVDGLDLGVAMLKGYVQEYGTDKDWTVLHTEAPFQIDVIDDSGELIAVYCGTWDLMVWDKRRKKWRLVDHKTAKAFQSFEWLSINDQGGSYLWVAPEVLLHKGLWDRLHPIDGITFNYLRKAMPDERPTDAQGRSLNKPTAAEKRLHGADYPGSVSKRQPAPRYHREETFRSPDARVSQYRKVVNEIEHMNLMRSGELAPYKTPTPDCVRCPLFDVCDLHDQGDDWEDMLEATFVQRDPYADHRAAMEEGGVEISGGITTT